ncbi:GNAT family N-acetyltransferase [Clostridium sp. CF012]|nr:GNAT family N-acetyltransferase [Clostridium sp. CF012]
MPTEIICDDFPQIETKRLILKEISVKDCNYLFEIFSDEEVLKYYDIEPLKTLEEANNLIQLFCRRFKNKKGIRWGIHLKNTDKLIGTCGYQSIDIQSLRTDIGYEMSKEYWGQGLMKEALQAIIGFGFNNMSLNRIQALVEPNNKNSIQLLHRIGFSEEGILSEYEHYKGVFKDLTILSLLKSKYTLAKS